MYRIVVPRLASRNSAQVVSQRRALAVVPPQHGTPNRKEAMAAYGGNTALLVGGVTLLGAIGYYMTRKDGKPPPPDSMKQQARDFKETAVAKGNTDAQQAKSRVQEEVERARATTGSAIDRTKNTVHDIKSSAEQRAASTRDIIVGTAEDAKREAEREAERAKAAGSGWFAWSKDKAEERKEDAAKGVARQAENTRVAAEKRA